jgi:hypothetical protein
LRPVEQLISTPTSFEIAGDAAFLGSKRGSARICSGTRRKAYQLFRENPAHPSLQFKKVSDRGPVYAARVTLDYRTLGALTGGEVVWFWIGSHADYDRLLRAI